MIHKFFLWLAIQQKRAVVRDLKQELDYHITTKPDISSIPLDKNKEILYQATLPLEYQEWQTRRDRLRNFWSLESGELHLLGG